jgi:hypothetical protein
MRTNQPGRGRQPGFFTGLRPALHRRVAFLIAACTLLGAAQGSGGQGFPRPRWPPGVVLIEAALVVSDRLPNAIDRHVASRVRLRRREMGLSQETVADALGVTFQQFQKYEQSINRISAGALYRLALTLEVPVQYFFEGLKGRRIKRPPHMSAAEAEARRLTSKAN